MTITGLENNLYFVNNPIWVNVDNLQGADWVRVILAPQRFQNEIQYSQPTSQRLYPFQNKLYFDLSDYAKTFFKKPQHPASISNNQPIETNYQRIVVIIQKIVDNAISEQFTATKDFIFGGTENYGSNVYANPLDVLKESVKLPRWEGYPLAKYYVDGAGVVRFVNILEIDEVEPRVTIGCNPLYLRWLNTKGGYSFWLFERWTLTKKTGKPTEIGARPTTYNLGNEPSWSLEVSTKCERRYYKTMRSLAQSPEVSAYDLTGIAIDDTGASQSDGAFLKTDVKFFEPVINMGNQVQTDGVKDVDEFKFNFDCVLTMKPQLKW